MRSKDLSLACINNLQADGSKRPLSRLITKMANETNKTADSKREKVHVRTMVSTHYWRMVKNCSNTMVLAYNLLTEDLQNVFCIAAISLEPVTFLEHTLIVLSANVGRTPPKPPPLVELRAILRDCAFFLFRALILPVIDGL